MTEKYIMRENRIPDGILHDRNLCDISLKENELVLTFKIEYYPQDYTDTTFAEKYKNFTKCHMKCTLGDLYFCNAVLKTALDENDNFTGKYISVEEFVQLMKNELMNQTSAEYIETYVSPNTRIALIELSCYIKYEKKQYDMCTLELNTEEIEYIWE